MLPDVLQDEVHNSTFKVFLQDFPGGLVVKNSPAKARDMGSISGPGRSHMLRGNWRKSLGSDEDPMQPNK